MARSKGIEELADASQKQCAQAQAMCAAEMQLAAQCTFRPDTRKPLIPDAQYTPAKAAFTLHDQPAEQLVQRCAPTCDVVSAATALRQSCLGLSRHAKLAWRGHGMKDACL